jgi:hypothetical protein
MKPYETVHSYEYDGRKIPYSIWHNDTLPTQAVVFLGAAQIGRIPRWIALVCPPGTAVVQGAPYWLAREDGSDTEAFMHQFTADALSHVLHSNSNGSVHAIAESQAVPGLLHILAGNIQFANRLQRLTLLQPLGLNATVFGTTDQLRLQEFKRRIARNARYQLASMLDRRLLYNHSQLFLQSKYGSSKSGARYAKGLGYDSLPDVVQLHAHGIDMRIVCGANDRMFPATEIQAALTAAKLDIPITVVPGVPHSPLATKSGAKLLAAAFVR